MPQVLIDREIEHFPDGQRFGNRLDGLDQVIQGVGGGPKLFLSLEEFICRNFWDQLAARWFESLSDAINSTLEFISIETHPLNIKVQQPYMRSTPLL